MASESIRCCTCGRKLAETEGLRGGRLAIKCPRCRAVTTWAPPTPRAPRPTPERHGASSQD